MIVQKLLSKKAFILEVENRWSGKEIKKLSMRFGLCGFIKNAILNTAKRCGCKGTALEKLFNKHYKLMLWKGILSIAKEIGLEKYLPKKLQKKNIQNMEADITTQDDPSQVDHNHSSLSTEGARFLFKRKLFFEDELDWPQHVKDEVANFDYFQVTRL